MRLTRTSRACLLLALFLSPLVLYLGAYRPIPAPGGGGAGLDNCGIGLTRDNPRADPSSLALCDPAERRATFVFAGVLALELGLVVVACVVVARTRGGTVGR